MKKVFKVMFAVLMTAVFALFAGCTKPLAYGKEMAKYESQLDALNQLKAGSVNMIVIDSIMAGWYTNVGDTYADYEVIDGLVLATEQYGIAAKKGNQALISKINEGLIALKNSGAMSLTASLFGLQGEIAIPSDATDPLASATDNSWADVVSDGVLTIGYTVFEPIAYPIEGVDTSNDDNMTGYDIELARAVVAYLNLRYGTNVTIDFEVITWSAKEAMLENGSIDLVWNGMTITEEREATMEISIPYLNNKQVVVIAKADADLYPASDFANASKNAVIGVESGSAGQSVVEG
ncbi:MAG: transporter substrate-binding domain-containing protein [Clostridia bacterium]|nr:transporter substrate-binding domain-containing protein [Clostridia bacterium]